MARNKKNLSLADCIIEKGLKRSEELGFDFSSYVTYLINLDIQGLIGNNLDCKRNYSYDEMKNKLNEDEVIAMTVNKELESDIDEILNGNI